MSTPFVLQIPQTVYVAMIDQAKKEQPNECCGLLSGRVISSEHKFGSVVSHYPLTNILASALEYLSDPRSMFEAMRAMRHKNEEVLAVYHSHPTSDPVPSQKDLARNYSPEVMNLIISLKGSEPKTRGWWLNETSFVEARWEIV